LCYYNGIEMFMQKQLYKILLFLLRGLVYGKRAVVWLFFNIIKIFSLIAKWYRAFLGYRVYQFQMRFVRYIQSLRIEADGRVVGFLGQRGVLQILFFVIALGIMFPHSKLYTYDEERPAGQKTVLYALAGPGDQDFNIEEEYIDLTLNVQQDTRTWNEGALSGETSGESIPIYDQEILGDSDPVAALTKPTIITGAELPGTSSVVSPSSQKRKESVDYVIQSGDVLGKIAQKFGLQLNTLLWANNLTLRSYIQPGDTLKIPPVNGVSHTVKRGETVSKIARIYDAEMKEIIEYNKLKNDGSDIVVGESLMIPGGTVRTVTRSYSSVATTAASRSGVSSVSAPRTTVNTPAGSGYIWPCTARVITQYWGWRHTGLDIAGGGTHYNLASKAGKVILSRTGWNGGYGNYVIVDHGNGVQTLYAHHWQNFVSVGDWVVQGQRIGTMGSTGRSTGPHLHFEIRINGRRVNPLQYIRR
jgi:murein DD-endopeptidase MepM/ murein hydrolase activator NlpD